MSGLDMVDAGLTCREPLTLSVYVLCGVTFVLFYGADLGYIAFW